jgi:hypothetical protein
MKYLDIHYHAVRERIAAGHFEVHCLGTNEQLADILTEPLFGSEVAERRDSGWGCLARWGRSDGVELSLRS